jgi:hypothetical protein
VPTYFLHMLLEGAKVAQQWWIAPCFFVIECDECNSTQGKVKYREGSVVS